MSLGRLHPMIVALSAIGAIIASIGSLIVREWRDPVVERKRMSEWAFALVRESYARDEYRVRPPYMKVFQADRETAMRWLMAAASYRPSRARIQWTRITGKLPSHLRKFLRPAIRSTSNRWAAVLALSSLAREEPDLRICEFLMSCMNHENTAVRKVAAFESGPWLCPGDPKRAILILGKALEDPSSEVRRDACRRLAYSATHPPDAYTLEARRLLPKLQRLGISDAIVRSHAAKAVQALED